jgi:CheY-like chemotaxis protein
LRRSEPPQLLIVEDDVDLADMLGAFFDAQGYTVASTGWGMQALEMATEQPPDLIVLDIGLPDLDGFEVSRRLRERHVTRHVPIIFLTEYRTRPERLQGLALGVTDYMTKPFDVQELRLRVRNALDRAARLQTANPITGLPEREQVLQVLHSLGGVPPGSRELLVVSLRGLAAFRESYGFVASDDVLRVISLTLAGASDEICGEDGFCGHLDDDLFVLVAPARLAAALSDRIAERLHGTLDLFYPASDRGPYAHSVERLALSIARAGAPPAADDAGEVKRALLAAPQTLLVE